MMFSLRFFQIERYGIDTKSISCWLWAVLKDMAQMRITPCTHNLGANHSILGVLLILDIVFVDWLPKARPARTGIIFCVGAEQFIAATGAAIDTIVFAVCVFAGKWRLCCLHSAYFKLFF